jgi:hypothetical protein
VPVSNGCGALPVDLRTEAAEAQRVIPVGTHATAELEPRLLFAALDAQPSPPVI